ncbi:MAG TPA: TolC family protein [Rhodocyclaceae bacterium]|nr:TolC family protein [Rhodocyclaceae bacterium]
MFSRPHRILLATGLGLASLSAFAASLSDPFGTQSDVKPYAPCAAPADSTALSLSHVVDSALCANPLTREVWANARFQAAQLGISEAAWLPAASATASSGRSRSSGVTSDVRSVGLSASWLLFDFGTRSATIENSRQLLVAANATRDATVQSLLLTAVQAFYQVQGAVASLDAARQAEAAALESFKAADARYKVGSATSADKLQAQTALSQAQLTRISAEGSLKTQQGVLNQVIGRDAQRPIVIAATEQSQPPESFERNLEALVTEARRQRPDLLAAEAQVAAADASINAARAAHLPSISLGFSASDQKTGTLPDLRSGSVGVTLSVPLFSGFATTYKVEQAQAQKEVREAQADRLRLQVAQDVWSAWQSLQTSTQSVRTTADLIASAEQSDKVARGRYAAGVGTLLEMLNAQSALASARQQRVQALYTWNVARATLAQALGTLDTNQIAADTAQRP